MRGELAEAGSPAFISTRHEPRWPGRGPIGAAPERDGHGPCNFDDDGMLKQAQRTNAATKKGRP